MFPAQTCLLARRVNYTLWAELATLVWLLALTSCANFVNKLYIHIYIILKTYKLSTKERTEYFWFAHDVFIRYTHIYWKVFSDLPNSGKLLYLYNLYTLVCLYINHLKNWKPTLLPMYGNKGYGLLGDRLRELPLHFFFGKFWLTAYNRSLYLLRGYFQLSLHILLRGYFQLNLRILFSWLQQCYCI